MKSDSNGFSMVELMVTIAILGLVFAFSVPMFKGFSNTQQLKGATEDIAAQLRLAREKAISTGTTQYLKFQAGLQGSDYCVWDGTTAYPKWNLPRNITYEAGSSTDFRMTKEGRCLDSGYIVLKDTRGNRDTVSVQLSGFVLVK